MNEGQMNMMDNDGFTETPEKIDCGDAAIVKTANGMETTHINIISVAITTTGMLLIESYTETHGIKTTYAKGQWVSVSQLAAYKE